MTNTAEYSRIAQRHSETARNLLSSALDCREAAQEHNQDGDYISAVSMANQTDWYFQRAKRVAKAASTARQQAQRGGHPWQPPC